LGTKEREIQETVGNGFFFSRSLHGEVEKGGRKRWKIWRVFENYNGSRSRNPIFAGVRKAWAGRMGEKKRSEGTATTRVLHIYLTESHHALWKL